MLLSLNQKLCDFTRWPHGLFNETERIGMEIEVEAERFPNLKSKYWTMKDDGSLRHGVEYVLVRPLSPEIFREALEEWKRIVRDFKFNKSIRTSIHLHLNVQHMTNLQIINIICAYWLIENVILKFAGPDREGNLFCLRLKDADGTAADLSNSIVNGIGWRTFGRNSHKYSALNLATILQFGTLEFRSLGGIYDYNTILNWTELHLNIFDKAIKLENPIELVKYYEKNGPESIINMFMTPVYQDLVLANKEYLKLINENIPYIIEVAQTHSWKEEEEVKKKKTKKEPSRFDTILQEQDRWARLNVNVNPMTEIWEFPVDPGHRMLNNVVLNTFAEPPDDFERP
jgi:hypothetical protein